MNIKKEKKNKVLIFFSGALVLIQFVTIKCDHVDLEETKFQRRNSKYFGARFRYPQKMIK